MDWFKESIPEAVTKAKIRNAIFVVFVEGKCAESTKMKEIIDNPEVRHILESDDFIAIKIDSTSAAYMQFASIYKMVPIPSIFFIGKGGEPLDIGTSVIATSNEMLLKINKVLILSGKKVEAVPEQNQIPNEGNQLSNEDSSLRIDNKECTDAPQADRIDVEQQPVVESSTNLQNVPLTAEELELYDLCIEKGCALEEMESEKYQEQLPAAEEKEKMDTVPEHEDKAIRDNMAAHIFAERSDEPEPLVEIAPQQAAGNVTGEGTIETPISGRVVRVQFRFKNGDLATHTFCSNDKFYIVRMYVKKELIPATGIKHFKLSTVYPKRELNPELDEQTLIELDLFPSCVVLVNEADGPAMPPILSYSFVLNVLRLLYEKIMTPLQNGYNYIMGKLTTSNDKDGSADKPNVEEKDNQDTANRQNIKGRSSSGSPSDNTASAKFNDNSTNSNAYRRFGSNIHRLYEHHEDSDDENATWNGNSTQQQ